MQVQPAQASTVSGDRTLAKDLVKTPALTVYWITFRVTSSRLTNPRVRLAIAQAIDRNAYVSKVFQGQGRATDTFIPDGMRGYASDLASVQKFDAPQARAMLASAGVSAAQLSGIKLSFDKSVDFAKATAQFVHDQLKANLGVDIALDPLDANTLGSRLAAGSFDMAGPIGWTADYPDAADWFQIFTTTNSNNYSLYQNARYDGLVAAAAGDNLPSHRDSEYSQAQKILLSEAPAALLAQNVSWYLVGGYVKGVTTTSIDEWPGAVFPSRIYISSH